MGLLVMSDTSRSNSSFTSKAPCTIPSSLTICISILIVSNLSVVTTGAVTGPCKVPTIFSRMIFMIESTTRNACSFLCFRASSNYSSCAFVQVSGSSRSSASDSGAFIYSFEAIAFIGFFEADRALEGLDVGEDPSAFTALVPL
ncbi:hypothetical protein PF004_g22641 [Phytophthora fragariae]|uniref:Uncharacterized protein n=1 Tax=Phytophthora fragariae TaxID=53985 RepID=A0A6G0N0A0_9STRA|nr:hypothetical protein PF004_g22641 [Phytophthora fragariae]